MGPRARNTTTTEAYDLAIRVAEKDTETFHFGLADNLDGGTTGTIVLNERNFVLARPASRVTANWFLDELVLEDKPNQRVAADDLLLWVADSPAEKRQYRVRVRDLKDSDEGFLRRAVESARGAPPSAIEQRYFAEDKDAKKRERLLDLLLKDPAVAKKVGDDWKKKMLKPPPPTVLEYAVPYQRAEQLEFSFRYLELVIPSRFEKLVAELLAAKKTDE